MGIKNIKGNLNIDGNLVLNGDLTVAGTSLIQNTETLSVKDNIIVTNTNGNILIENAGFAIKTNTTDVYGIMYDPVGDGVKIGLGSLDESGKFNYTEGEDQFLATRANIIADGHTVVWDDENKTLIDSGVAHSEFVKFTDYATKTKAGLVSPRSKGFAIGSHGELYLLGASQQDIAAKGSGDIPITPSMLDYAVKVGITTNTETLTDEEKAAACSWLGAFPNVLTDLSGDGYIPFYNPNTEKYGYKRAYGSYIGRNSLVMRDGNGDIHGKTPTAESAGTVLVNKEYVDNGFVQYKKTSGLMKVYGNDTNGEVTMFAIRQAGQATAGAHIPQTDANGVLHAMTPAADDNGTSLVTKNYIDGWELINKVTLTEEAKRIRCETDSNGNEFLLKKVMFIVRSQPSTEATGSATLYYCVSTAKKRGQSSTVHQVAQLDAGLRTTAQQNAAYVEQKFYIPSGRTEGQGLVILSISGGDNASLKSKYLTRDIRPNIDEQYITTAYVESGSDTTIFGVGSEFEIWGVRA